MGKVTFVTSDGAEFPVRVKNGQSLMEAAVRAGVRGIEARCGGAAACATCHIVIGEDWASRLPAPRALELAMLDNLRGREGHSRLACQVRMRDEYDGMRLAIPEAQGLATPIRTAKSTR